MAFQTKKSGYVNRALIYVRFSPKPEKIAEACDSLETQLEYVRAGIKQKGWSYDPRLVFKEPMSSGGDRHRAVLAEALVKMRRFDVLCVHDWGRLARDTYGTLAVHDQIKKVGGYLWSLREGFFDTEADPMLKLANTMLAAFQEHQRMLISARCKAGQRRRIKNGGSTGKCLPYGWEPDPASPLNPESGYHTQMRPNAEEQRTIKRIYQLRDEGLGISTIQKVLNGEGLLHRGKPWRFYKAIWKILQRRTW